VLISLVGLIRDGDFANISATYRQERLVRCLNSASPGRYELIPADQFEKWKQNWSASHPNGTNNTGKIGDYEQLKFCHSEFIRDDPAQVNGKLKINSPGGNLFEAMKIGRWVRQNRLGVVAEGNCASACVWILAAGLTRDVIPTTLIQVHRPYLTRDGGATASQHLRDALRDSKDYFDEMGVPSELAERMFSVPPDTSKVLTWDQLSYYRLNQPEMGFKEEEDFAAAKRLGLSRDDYTQRMQRFNHAVGRCPTILQGSGFLAHVKCEEKLKLQFGLAQEK
jgi:hypothetical protein